MPMLGTRDAPIDHVLSANIRMSPTPVLSNPHAVSGAACSERLARRATPTSLAAAAAVAEAADHAAERRAALTALALKVCVPVGGHRKQLLAVMATTLQAGLHGNSSSFWSSSCIATLLSPLPNCCLRI